MTTYEFWWNLANRLRHRFGRPCQPRRCCRSGKYLGPAVQDAPDLTYRRCSVCGSRHFTLTADPLRLNLKGAAL